MALQFFTFCFALLLSGAVFAYPNIGDKVQWTGVVSQPNGGSTEVKISKEVISFDKKTSKWTVKYEATMGAETTTKLIEEEDLFSPKRYKEIIAQCTSQGGVLEKVKAPAGTYETCKITTTTSEGTLVEKWWGNIPFGVVSKNTRAPNAGGTKPDLNSVIAGL